MSCMDKTLTPIILGDENLHCVIHNQRRLQVKGIRVILFISPCGNSCMGTGSALPCPVLPSPPPTTKPIRLISLEPIPCVMNSMAKVSNLRQCHNIHAQKVDNYTCKSIKTQTLSYPSLHFTTHTFT